MNKMLWQELNDSCQKCARINTSFGMNSDFKRSEHVCMGQNNCTDCDYDGIMELDKGVHQIDSPGKHDTDLSLYGNNTCPSSSSIPQSCHRSHNLRKPLRDFDLNSQDSGLGSSLQDKETHLFKFGETESSSSCKDGNQLFKRFSTSSVESMDDGFMDLTDMDTTDENTILPCNFDTLISGSLINKTPVQRNCFSRPPFRRSLSLKEQCLTPINRVRNCLFKSDSPDSYESRPFKRPDPPVDITCPIQPKRYRSNKQKESSSSEQLKSAPKITRSLSANEAYIMSAVQRSCVDPDLIGDFSKPFCLPLVTGKHQDLKSISPSTLANLLCDKYNEIVSSYKVIDCRYPYEYEGGHISNAINYYTKEQISDLVEQNRHVSTPRLKRDILVFHCEFSSERGPNLSRFLRKLDRSKNNDSYPALDYPEVYLLDGGYKNFFEQYPNLCEPTAYRPMLDPAHENDFKKFRAKSKTWNADTRHRAKYTLYKRSCIL